MDGGKDVMCIVYIVGCKPGSQALSQHSILYPYDTGGCWLPAQLFTVMWWETHWVKDVLDQSLAGCGCWLAWTQSQYLESLGAV